MNSYCSDTCMHPGYWFNRLYVENGYCCSEGLECTSGFCFQGTCQASCYTEITINRKKIFACCERDEECESKHCEAGFCVGILIYDTVAYNRQNFIKYVAIAAILVILVFTGIIIGCQYHVYKITPKMQGRNRPENPSYRNIKLRRNFANFPFDLSKPPARHESHRLAAQNSLRKNDDKKEDSAHDISDSNQGDSSRQCLEKGTGA